MVDQRKNVHESVRLLGLPSTSGNSSFVDSDHLTINYSNTRSKKRKKMPQDSTLLQNTLFFVKEIDYYCKILQKALIFVKVPSKKKTELSSPNECNL